MKDRKLVAYVKNILVNMPADWLSITTHRLDIYNEKLAKTEFLSELENLYSKGNSEQKLLRKLPTAYDYIRLGHPLSCVLEWCIAKNYQTKAANVISFSSVTVPILAVLRKNLLENRNTQIAYVETLPEGFNSTYIRDIYGYQFEVKQVASIHELDDFDGSVVFVSETNNICNFQLEGIVDFYLNYSPNLGSVLLINGVSNESYISDIQHVRRRETIAMTPVNCEKVLNEFVSSSLSSRKLTDYSANKQLVLKNIKEITGSYTKALVGSSGLSIQYAIMMGLIHMANEKHAGKDIKFIVPTNCYGGTNDQARRVAACIKNVEVVDLEVDGNSDMVNSIDTVLSTLAIEDAVPYIIAEIPTNPRVEVPDLDKLKEVLSIDRKTATGALAVQPVFILDQTFCPNLHFLGDGKILSTVSGITYASGSKFPSGGKCTAGYCVGNKKAASIMEKIELHLAICDNEATPFQYGILAQQLPSMLKRIDDAYENTRDFVNFIHKTLPSAKINFVSDELAKEGFRPSVFSLDLPTKGNNPEEKEVYKRQLNHTLINLMITEIPDESKYCVSYGQLQGCYWTIPATSTQGTTKEGDKDYIARVALSPKMDLNQHKIVFSKFVEGIE